MKNIIDICRDAWYKEAVRSLHLHTLSQKSPTRLCKRKRKCNIIEKEELNT